MQKVGFIGLGNMGRGMAARLVQAGHDTVVHDVRDELRGQFESRGAAWAGSAQEVGDVAEMVAISLPTPRVVEQVLLGDGGLIKGRAVRIVVDTSTTGPEVSRRAAQRLGERGIKLVDAPVSGGMTGAEEGTLSIMASGDRQAFDAVSPLLSSIGRHIFYLGPDAGQGQMMKIINNTMCAVATLASFEGLVLGSRAGIDAQTMLEILNVSSGRSFATEVKIPQCVVQRNFPQRFTTDLLHKDVKLCIDEAQRLGVPMWVSDSARQMLSFAIGQGDGPVDYANIIKRYEAWAKVQFGGDTRAQAGTVKGESA
ncbi:NAD(P)-dependent oxidoreductase [Variovorax paradoxus]|nr:NAD(P)-dependent oxidoreductase [Variovorax paradoxus]MBT2305211.1 NAD(P)-dependent oxidoreductase [Variovorax paradoxus]